MSHSVGIGAIWIIATTVAWVMCALVRHASSAAETQKHRLHKSTIFCRCDFVRSTGHVLATIIYRGSQRYCGATYIPRPRRQRPADGSLIAKFIGMTAPTVMLYPRRHGQNAPAEQSEAKAHKKKPDNSHTHHGPCVDGSKLARRIFTSQAWSVQPCVRPHMMASPSRADVGNL
jgi:hypothetical protein